MAPLMTQTAIPRALKHAQQPAAKITTIATKTPIHPTFMTNLEANNMGIGRFTRLTRSQRT